MSTIQKRILVQINETCISNYSSVIVALSGSNAIRIFPAGEILVNSGLWGDGVSLLHGKERLACLYLWYIGIAVSAVL